MRQKGERAECGEYIREERKVWTTTRTYSEVEGEGKKRRIIERGSEGIARARERWMPK